MPKSKLQKATGINWKLRFTNPQFLVRTAIGIILPALAYLGINYELAFTSWEGAGEALMMILKSPAALFIILMNFLNLIPDPTRSAIGDSEMVMERKTPKIPTKEELKQYETPQEFQYPEETPNATMEEQMDELEEQREEDKLKK